MSRTSNKSGLNMSRRVTNPSRRRRKAADDPTLVSFLWPIVIGVLITFLTIRVAGILVLMGREQFAVLYPWVALVRLPFLRIDYGSAAAIGQMLMYFQFPIYGFIAGTVLYMSNKMSRAFLTVLSAHLVALIAFIAITIFHP